MKSENKKCTAYDKRKAVTSCKNSSLIENLRPVSFTEAEKADMHGGQSSKNVEAASAEESSSPVPSGISMEIVAAMFSLAEKPEIKAKASRQSVMPIGRKSGRSALEIAASILYCTSQGASANVKLDSTQLTMQKSITAVATLIINPFM